MTAAERVAVTLAAATTITATVAVLTADWIAGHLETAIRHARSPIDDDEIRAAAQRIDAVNAGRA